MHNSNENRQRPKLIAFDLDDTLWSPEMWLCSGPPFQKVEDGVLCKNGEVIRLMGDSAEILEELALHPDWQDVIVVYVSRTTHQKWAEVVLPLMQIGVTGKSMSQLSEVKLNQIYPDVKTQHFAQIQKHSGVPYSDMLFFDNEHRNIRDVSELGVVSVLTPDGMTSAAWANGLARFSLSKE